ncbi:MAG: 4-carboxymuconolactone decarboxylase [Nitriliruptorales bacterium]|nr:4-carboxymuconolactone decarboxylase [Nitriliruptorales bacterium]
MRVRREVLGDMHVDAAQAATTRLDADFQHFLSEFVWGAVWTRSGLDRRTRSLITIALLAGLGHAEELELHLRASRNTGAHPAEIAETLLHVAAYAGVPAANAAFRAAKMILEKPDVGKED